MKRVEIESSNIQSVGYDLDKHILEVEFLSGAVYNYFKVPNKTYKEFMNAKSKGKYFYKNIRESFKYKKV